MTTSSGRADRGGPEREDIESRDGCASEAPRAHALEKAKAEVLAAVAHATEPLRSKRAVLRAVGGRQEAVFAAVDALLRDGSLAVAAGVLVLGRRVVPAGGSRGEVVPAGGSGVVPAGGSRGEVVPAGGSGVVPAGGSRGEVVPAGGSGGVLLAEGLVAFGTRSRVEAAIEYGRRGFRVVPLHSVTAGRCTCARGTECASSAGKHPKLRRWQKEASRDLATIARWWRAWPDANVGLAMGGPARLVALDIDGEAGRASLARLEAEHEPLPPTLTSRSGRLDGGEHRLFLVHEDLDLDKITNCASKLAPGLDVRAEGGQIVVAPSLHRSGNPYAWVNDAPIAQLPRWLYDRLIAPKAAPLPQVPVEKRPATRRSSEAHGTSAYARAALEKACSALEGAPLGERNATMNREAYALGGLIAAGALDERQVETALLDAARRGRWDARAIASLHTATLRRALRDGIAAPRTLPEPRPFAPPAQPARAEPDEDVEREAIQAEVEAAVAPPRLHVARASQPDPRPLIRLSVDVHDVADRAVEALRADPALYHRDGALVHVTPTAEAEADQDPSIVAGTPQIRRMPAPTLLERLTRAARWERYDARAEEWVPAIPPDRFVQVIHCRGAWDGIRPIVGIIEAPALRPDGTVITSPGYDRATGFLYLPNVDFPEVPEKPTEEDARAALAELEDVFCDFPYARPEHRSAVIAAILTLVARPAIRGAVPGFLFDASTRGSGKTLQADAVSLIGTGRTTAKMSYPADDAELEKVLGSYALRAPTLVNFDNLSRPFGGGPLDRVLTAEDTVELRVLGKSEIPTLRWRSVVVATGNNIALAGDTARRVVVSRLESPLENPEERAEFKRPDLLEWVRRERPRLISAALTILRAFIAAGRPRGSCKPWGSFGPWAELIPPAILFAGGADPMLARPTVSGEEEPEKQALAVVLREWSRLDPTGQGLTAKATVGLLYSPERIRGRNLDGSPLAPDGFDDLREAIEALVHTKPGQAPDTTRLGYKLRAFRGRVVGDRKLCGVSAGQGVQRWRVVHVRAAAA